jgi:hypothetical protein
MMHYERRNEKSDMKFGIVSYSAPLYLQSVKGMDNYFPILERRTLP